MISKLLEGLNKEQMEAVLHTDGPLSIIAGAGSGKTKVITTKIAYIIEKELCKPWEILAMTFTNKSAKEMKDRVEVIFGGESSVNISTIHSIAYKILRIEGKALGYKPNFPLWDNLDQKQVLKNIYKTYSITWQTFPYAEMVSWISKNKILGVSCDEILAEDTSDTIKIKAKVYRDYQIEINRIKAMDFDDLLINLNLLFEKFPEINKKWGNKYKYILVDEFQDISKVQYRIIRALSLNDNITVVGDPDQTIYTWRQADANIITDFSTHFKSVKQVKLVQNYRSTKKILNAANKMIKKNTNRIKKELITDNEEGEPIVCYAASSDDHEARWIIQKILELKKEKNQLRDMAILYRANYQSQSIEKKLIEHSINYVIYGGTRFYQRKEIKDAIAYLKIMQSYDEISLIRMINIPARKLGKVAVAKLVKFAKEKELGILDSIINFSKDVPLTPSQTDELFKFVNLVMKYKKALTKYPISIVLKKFLIEVDYFSIWKLNEDKQKKDSVDELVKSIEVWEKENEDKTLVDFITEVSLYISSDKAPKSQDFLSLSSVHAAKGQEYKNVFLLGFADGIFPSQRTINESGKDGIEEERRLAYVAVTRAKEKMYISYTKNTFGQDQEPKEPSRFLKEMGLKIDGTFTFKDNKVTEGDQITHINFGKGLILSVQGDMLVVDFGANGGIKNLLKNHSSIEKISEGK